MKKSIYSSEQETLNSLLRKYRNDKGLSQVELARKLHRSQSYVSKYESGELQLDLMELREICQALGISLSNFVRTFEKELG